jgi:hypothetical protein
MYTVYAIIIVLVIFTHGHVERHTVYLAAQVDSKYGLRKSTWVPDRRCSWLLVALHCIIAWTIQARVQIPHNVPATDRGTGMLCMRFQCYSTRQCMELGSIGMSLSCRDGFHR